MRVASITERWRLPRDTVNGALSTLRGDSSLQAEGGVSASSLAPLRHQPQTRRCCLTFLEQSAASPDGRPALAVYIGENCDSCRVAVEVAERVRREFPRVDVSVVDLDVSAGPRPDKVFAVPTFILDGEIVSLGTPTWERLAPLLRSVLDEGERP